MHGGARLLHIDVESNRAVQLQTQLAEVLAAFEQAVGLEVCLRPLSDRWRGPEGTMVVPHLYGGHRSAFCDDVKVTQLAACIRCDLTDLPADCFPAEGRRELPFVRTCHAGADEVILPLWSDGQLVATLFVGQFRSSRAATPRTERLPSLAPERVAHVLALTLPLRGYLTELLRTLADDRTRPAPSRAHLVEQYLREALPSGPTLAGLAARLSLSPSRTTHVVRELTGRSFQKLVEDLRITVAKDLLANGDSTVAWIARQTGMQSTAYFCRYFKHKTGLTPTAFRRLNRRTTQV